MISDISTTYDRDFFIGELSGEELVEFEFAVAVEFVNTPNLPFETGYSETVLLSDFSFVYYDYFVGDASEVESQRLH